MAKTKADKVVVRKDPVRKVTSIGRHGRPKDKHKRSKRNYKRYQGQGRP